MISNRISFKLKWLTLNAEINEFCDKHPEVVDPNSEHPEGEFPQILGAKVPLTCKDGFSSPRVAADCVTKGITEGQWRIDGTLCTSMLSTAIAFFSLFSTLHISNFNV